MQASIFRTAAVAASLVAVLSGCQVSPATETSVNRVLMAPDNENLPYSRVLVVGATPSRETDRIIEEGLLGELRDRGVQAHSFVRASSSTAPTEGAVAALVAEKSAGAVIVVTARLRDVEVVQVPEQVSVDPRVRGVRGGTLFDFFRYDYREIANPRYADVMVDVVFVTDVYDTASEDRVYSVESSTARGKTGYEVAIAESRAIADRMHKDGLIP